MTKKNTEKIFGLHAVRHVFKNDFSRVMEMWVQQGLHSAKLEALLKQAEQQGIAIQSVPKKTLDNLSDNGHHQGILIRCKASQIQSSLENIIASSKTPFFLVLDEVQDPHNLGACLRTADAAGIDAVIVPKNQACQLTGTVHQVACGATVPFISVTNLARTLRWLQEQGVWLVGTEAESQSTLFETNLTGSLAFVLGAEGRGLRRLTRETCDLLVRIPMSGTVESLNVSVATGVCLYEAVRQRSVQAV
ncbi:23S rRNA methyltransferase [Candidatus Thiomargarita nelsonii]|uniref:23S rRNA (guanosine-2'-O-)-methyltransferase RlmB n=1 Tax=Candidatus Thiomargarita nelsonii TaxID=1003181 RepID=A0A0A6PCM7_9GAMM|nr:23S rRNA methyltransferase [Candidatus Thiomargarita nelsonii]